MPDGPAYFCSRGSVMGQVPGELIASAFGVFNPAVVVPAVDARVDADRCRHHLRRPHPGRRRPARPDPRRRTRRPRSCDRAAGSGRSSRCAPRAGRCSPACVASACPAIPMGDVWRLGDMLREFRGDAHIAAWTVGRLRRHRDRAADRALLGPADAHLRAQPGLVERRPRRRRGPPARPRPARRRRLHRRGPAARRKRSRSPPTCSASRSSTRWATTSTSWSSIMEPWGAAIRAAGGYLPGGPHTMAAGAAR